MAEGGEVQDNFARCCITYILILIFLPNLLNFFLRVHNPTFYINEFNVPALNMTTNTTSDHNHNQTIFFSIILGNSMDSIDIDYYPIDLTFSYVPKYTGSDNNNGPPDHMVPLVKYTVPGFYQEGGGIDTRQGTVGAPWDDGSTVVFRVDLATRVKFYFSSSDVRIKKMDVTAIVEVDASGRKLHENPIQFISIPSRNK